MSDVTACPLCAKPLRLPADAGGRRLSCPGCSKPLRVGEEMDELRLVPLCIACGAERGVEDAFCPECGVSQEGEAEGETPPPPPERSSRRRSSFAGRARARKMRVASTWIMVVAVIFALSGTIQGLMVRSDAKEARTNLRQFTDDERVVLDDGSTFLAGELREQIDLEVTMAFALNYGLALAMLLIWFWSRRSPLPAILTALGLYLTVIVLNGVLDPATLVQGVIIKAFVIIALSSGVRAALAQRAAEEREAARMS